MGTWEESISVWGDTEDCEQDVDILTRDNEYQLKWIQREEHGVEFEETDQLQWQDIWRKTEQCERRTLIFTW